MLTCFLTTLIHYNEVYKGQIPCWENIQKALDIHMPAYQMLFPVATASSCYDFRKVYSVCKSPGIKVEKKHTFLFKEQRQIMLFWRTEQYTAIREQLYATIWWLFPSSLFLGKKTIPRKREKSGVYNTWLLQTDLSLATGGGVPGGEKKFSLQRES